MRELDLRRLSASIFTAGFRPDYEWIDTPVTDELGFPIAIGGASTVLPASYFCGVHFLPKRRSSLPFGVGEDAALISRQITWHRP